MVTIAIYDMMGRKVRTLVSQSMSPGYHTTLWNATNDKGFAVSAGMYIYTIQAGSYHHMKKMVLLK
jgi:flagellar hook assembly protein FlgD